MHVRDCSVRIFVDDCPAFVIRTAATITKLVVDAGGALLLARVTGMGTGAAV